MMDSGQCAPLGDRRSGGPGVPQLKRPRSDSSWNNSFSASQHPRSAVKTCSSTAPGGDVSGVRDGLANGGDDLPHHLPILHA